MINIHAVQASALDASLLLNLRGLISSASVVRERAHKKQYQKSESICIYGAEVFEACLICRSRCRCGIRCSRGYFPVKLRYSIASMPCTPIRSWSLTLFSTRLRWKCACSIPSRGSKRIYNDKPSPCTLCHPRVIEQMRFRLCLLVTLLQLFVTVPANRVSAGGGPSVSWEQIIFTTLRKPASMFFFQKCLGGLCILPELCRPVSENVYDEIHLNFFR